MAYCVQADLEVAVGGAAVLVQLLDKNGDGVADTDQVTACLNRATAEINEAIGIPLDLDALSAPYPDALVYRTASIAAFYAWQQGAEGQTMPQPVADNYKNTQDWLTLVVRKERGLGVLPLPSSGQAVAQIDRNPGGAGVQRVPTFLSTRGAFW